MEEDDHPSGSTIADGPWDGDLGISIVKSAVKMERLTLSLIVSSAVALRKKKMYMNCI